MDKTKRANGSVRLAHAGFTLMELMIVVAIIGLLASVAIPSFIRLIYRVRGTEALMSINTMLKGAESYYESEHAAITGDILSRQFPDSDGAFGGCYVFYSSGICPGGMNGAAPFSDNSDTTIAQGTFAALNFGVDDPHYFTYFWADGTGNIIGGQGGGTHRLVPRRRVRFQRTGTGYGGGIGNPGNQPINHALACAETDFGGTDDSTGLAYYLYSFGLHIASDGGIKRDPVVYVGQPGDSCINLSFQ